MLITRTSFFSGIKRTQDLPITQEEFNNYQDGMLIQHAFPNLTPAQREFYQTGCTQEEWDNIFKED